VAAKDPPRLEALKLRDADHQIVGVLVRGRVEEPVQQRTQSGQLANRDVTHDAAGWAHEVLQELAGDPHVGALHEVQHWEKLRTLREPVAAHFEAPLVTSLHTVVTVLFVRRDLIVEELRVDKRTRSSSIIATSRWATSSAS